MNFITILLVFVFIVPILIGILSPFSGGLRHTLFSCWRSLELLFVVLASVLLTRLLFSHPENGLWTKLYAAVPPLMDSVYGQDVGLFLIAALVLLVLLYGAVRLAEPLILRRALIPLFDSAASRYRTMTGAAKRMLGAAALLPKSAALVLVFSMLFHFYIVYANNASLGDYIGQSSVYRMVDGGIVRPVLDSRLAGRTVDFLDSLFENAVRSVSLSRLSSFVYFNGVSLDDAVASNDALDELACELTAEAAGDRAKAALLYDWVCGSISYDFEKAEALSEESLSVSSGALEAYATGSGVCFDYSCLYISMCRAAGVRVRFVSGTGLSGGVWEAHAWNQIYDPSEDRWINVDTTFGSSGSNYFDRADFELDHTGGIILGEW